MEVCEQINQAEASFKQIEAFAKVQKAIEFKEAYKRRTGHRPSLVSIIALWQAAEARADQAEADLQAKIEEHEGA